MIYTLIVAVLGILYYYSYQDTSSRREELVLLNTTYDYIIGLSFCTLYLFTISFYLLKMCLCCE